MKSLSGNFHLFGSINVSMVADVLRAQPGLWAPPDFRNTHPLSPHKSTESIYLRWPKEMTPRAALFARDSEDKPAMAVKPLRAAVKLVEAILDRTAERAIIVKLAPETAISPHSDGGDFAHATNRYHVAIQSDPECRMRVEDSWIHFPEGEIWWFDKSKIHEVVNAASTPRIHLILDFPK